MQKQNRQRTGAAATITVIGGSLFVNGAPAQAAEFEVTNTDSSGAGSLAQAIADANLTSDADEITFASGLTGTISFAVTSNIKYDLSIVGPGDGSITIATAGADALYLYNGADLSVSGLALDAPADDSIAFSFAGDITLTDLQTTDSFISGNVAGAVTFDGLTSTSSSYNVGNLNAIESLDVSDMFNGSSSSYGSGTVRIYGIGTGVPADGDVVLAEFGGTLDGPRFRLRDIAGDVSVTDASLGTLIRARYLGDLMVSGVTGVAESRAGINAQEVDRAFVDDVDLSVGNGGGISVESIGPYGGDSSIERVTVTDIRDFSIDVRNVRGSTTISEVDGGGPYLSVGVSSAEGDVTISDLDMASPYASLSVDARTPSIMTGDPIPELHQVSISDVELGSEGGVTRLSVRDFAEIRIDGEKEVRDEVANVIISDTTVFGSMSVTDSNVSMSDVSVIGRGDGAGSRGFYLFNLVGEPADELIGDGSTPIRVSGGSLQASQVTVAGHKAPNALDLYEADVSFAHSTFADMDLSAATVGVYAYSDDADGSTLTLDHTVFAETGPDGEFVAEDAGGRRRIALTSSDLLTVTADYSVVGVDVIESESLTATNIEAADSRIGDVIAIPGRRPSAAPLADSPAVNAGNPEITDAPVTDQRGNARIRNTIDIGAVEVGSLLESIAPARFVDTRSNGETIDDEYEAEGKRAAGSTYTVQVAGRGDVPADATSVIMNVTSIQPDSNGFVTVFSCDDDQPTASSLNYTVGSNLGNEVVAGLAGDGTVCLFTSGATHLTVDVVAFATGDSPIQAITPARAFESRLGKTTADGRFGGSGQMPAGSQQTIAMGGRFGIPADATAVIINVTAINPTATGFATVYPCLPTRPTASSLNFTAGINRGNEIIAPLNSAGELCVYTSAATDLAIDVVGYLPDGSISPVTPSRLLETRDGQTTVDGVSQGGGAVAAASSTTVQIAGRVGVPAGAKAVVVNLTAINPSARGYATMHPCLASPPSAASLNYEAGVSGGNEVIAGLDDDGKLCVFSSASTNMSIDIVGYII